MTSSKSKQVIRTDEAQKAKTSKKDYKWISDFNIYSGKKNEMKVKEFDLDGQDSDLKGDRTERINTVNRQKSTVKMNEISS